MNEIAEPVRRPLWLSRWPWLLLLLILATVYYGSYYKHGINFRDEGGTLTLLGQRLLAGEIPFKDVELGYNVGWFAPIVGLFAITGTDFVALRIFFLVASTLAAVLAFLTVEKAARHAGRRGLALPLAFVTGLMVMVVPGMLFKNYNPLAAIANSWCLVGFILARGVKESCWRALVGGLILGATWLARIDLGTFFSVLWIGVLFLRLLGLPGTFGERFVASFCGLLLVAFGTAAVHAPVIWDASRRGYQNAFLGAYPSHWKMLANKASGLVGIAPPKPVQPAQPAQAEEKPTTPPPAQPVAKPAPTAGDARKGTWAKETLDRTSWSDFQKASQKSRMDVLGLFLLTYLPLLTMLPLIAWATARWVHALGSGRDSTGPLAALALLGGSLTMFPQFFFWRPDAPHLSEFGPGYWTAVIASTALLGAGASSRKWARLMAALLFLHAGVWLWRMLPDRWCGTIAARDNREVLFTGDNGVEVFEQKKTVAWMNEVLRLIREHSKPDDYLIAYPYHPSFNVLANRRTYEKNVYMDNAKAKPDWGAWAIKRIEQFEPKIIIVSDWDINGTEESRFRNWAADAYAHIRKKYDLLGTFDEKEKFELYVRKPKEPTAPVPPAPPSPGNPPTPDPAAAPAATPIPAAPAPAAPTPEPAPAPQ